MRFGDYVWMDGRLVRLEDAKVHVMAHALHYGTGVFEGIRCYDTGRGRAIFRLDDHLDRLYSSAKLLGMEIPYSKDELGEAVVETVRRSGLRDCYIRPIVFRGFGRLGLNPAGLPVHVAIGTLDMGAYLGEAKERGARVTVSKWRRLHPSCVPLEAKATGYYVSSALAKLDAVMRGYDEALLLDLDGYVVEGSGENLFIVVGDTLVTPPLLSGILPGITRDTVSTLARDMGLRVKEDRITLGQLLTADEAFFTGTAAEITPIVEVDGVKIGDGRPGKVTRAVQDAYERVVRGKEEKYLHWLTFVD